MLNTFSGKVAFRQFHFLLHPDPIIEVTQKKDKSNKKIFAYKGVEDFLGKGLLTNEDKIGLKREDLFNHIFPRKV